MIRCAICGKPCTWIAAVPIPGVGTFGGWYCKPCDAYTETDVELED